MSAISSSTDLIIKLPAVMTAESFTNDAEFEKLYAKINDVVSKHVSDTSNKSGRDAIASLAYKVSRTKTALVGQGKKLTETWRDQTKKVNSACNTIETRLDALRDTVRQPLNDWEAAETARTDGHKSRLAELVALGKSGHGLSSSEFRALLDSAESAPADESAWDEFAPLALSARETAIETLSALLVSAEKQEADAAELEQLRAAQAERAKQDAERLAAENVARELAAQAERDRLAAEAHQEEIAQAAETARLQADREAQERIEAAERAAREAADRAQREIAEAKAQADRIAEAERQRIADQQTAELAEQRRRDADKEHRKQINGRIVAELMECSSISERQAQKIVVQLVSGLVPNVTLKY